MWNRLAQVGLTGVAVCGVEPVAAIFPVLLAGVYETGSIEGPLLQYCTLDKTVLVVLLLLVAVHWLPKRSTVKKEEKKNAFSDLPYFFGDFAVGRRRSLWLPIFQKKKCTRFHRPKKIRR